jgi:hypothetical protein
MKSIITIKQTLKRYGTLLENIILALDTSPTELFYVEVHQLKQDIAELKYQSGLSAHSQKISKLHNSQP